MKIPKLHFSKSAAHEADQRSERDAYVERLRKTAWRSCDKDALFPGKRKYGRKYQCNEDTDAAKAQALSNSDMDDPGKVRQDSQPRSSKSPVCRSFAIRTFSDKLADLLIPHDFTLLKLNQTGSELKRISLYDFLQKTHGLLVEPKAA